MKSSLLDGLARFDAFPKLPSTYKTRSESRGFLTLFVILLALLLVLNDLAEYVWGWADYEFSVDTQADSYMNINVDMVVNTPCMYLSVDLRDLVGDRLFLSRGFHRDGTTFDMGQATTLKEHAKALSARQAVAQSRKSRGLFSFFNRGQPDYRPTYNHKADAEACRIYGSLGVKKVTANLHVTSLGHGYHSGVHVPHDKMNFSHVITEFSFGPYFPDIVQPLDYSFELAKEPFIAYQYYLHVVPTTYIAPRSPPLQTNQYSVTHYKRSLPDHQGTPGIFFKFDLDPMVITIHQRTTSLVQLLIRCVGVVGGVFTCASYFLRITVRAVEAVSGADATPGIVAAESTSVRRRWAGGQLRPRPNATAVTGRVVRQGSGWVVDGASPYVGTGMGTPMSSASPGAFGYAGASTPYAATTPGVPPPPSSSVAVTPTFGPGPLPPTSGPGVGLGLGAPPFGHSRTPSLMGGRSQGVVRSVSGEGGVGPAGVPLPPSPFMAVSSGSVPATPMQGGPSQSQAQGVPPPPRSAKKVD